MVKTTQHVLPWPHVDMVDQENLFLWLTIIKPFMDKIDSVTNSTKKNGQPLSALG